MNNKRKLIIEIFSFIVVMIMGYALFSETVTIKGSAKGEGNLSVIIKDIGQDYIDSYGGVKINKLKVTNGNKLDVDVSLDYPGSSIDIYIPIKNNGTIDAYIKNVNVEGLDNVDIFVNEPPQGYTKDVYIYMYEVDDNHNIPKDVSDFNGIELKVNQEKFICLGIIWNDEIENKNSNLNLKFDVKLDYEQLINSEIPGGGNAIPGYKYAVGDKICFNNECFNVLSNDGVNVRALASKNITTDIGTDVNPIYPKQDSNAGLIAFASTIYWTEPNNTNLLPKYGNNYPAYVFDNNSNLYPIVKKYEEYLKNVLHVNILETNLAVTQDLINMGCEYYQYGFHKCFIDKIKFENNTPFWLGDAFLTYGSTGVKGHGPTEDPSFSLVGFPAPEEPNFGIRPVIKVPLIEISKAYN